MAILSVMDEDDPVGCIFISNIGYPLLEINSSTYKQLDRQLGKIKGLPKFVLLSDYEDKPHQFLPKPDTRYKVRIYKLNQEFWIVK